MIYNVIISFLTLIDYLLSCIDVSVYNYSSVAHFSLNRLVQLSFVSIVCIDLVFELVLGISVASLNLYVLGYYVIGFFVS